VGVEVLVEVGVWLGVLVEVGVLAGVEVAVELGVGAHDRPVTVSV
jgi:hypothetical protein